MSQRRDLAGMHCNLLDFLTRINVSVDEKQSLSLMGIFACASCNGALCVNCECFVCMWEGVL